MHKCLSAGSHMQQMKRGEYRWCEGLEVERPSSVLIFRTGQANVEKDVDSITQAVSVVTKTGADRAERKNTHTHTLSLQ